jgi:hypothetical protein
MMEKAKDPEDEAFVLGEEFFIQEQFNVLLGGPLEWRKRRKKPLMEYDKSSYEERFHISPHSLIG